MNRQTVNALIRHQIYVEAFKNGQHKEADRLAYEVETVLAVALLRLGVDKLSELTKRQLNKLVATIRARLSGRYSGFAGRVTKMAESFAATDYGVVKAILAQTGDAEKIKKERSEKGFWSSVANAIVPGVGLTLAEMLKSLSASHIAEIVKIVKRGYADGLTPQQTLALVIKAKGFDGRKGFVNRAKAQTESVIETILQHVSAAAVFMLGGLLSERYQWVSVLDSRTTDICRSRNGRVYLYATGPRPPAHFNCRSTIVPYVAGIVIPKSYGAWLATQPRALIADIVGSGNKIPVEKFEKFVNRKRLTETQFKNKLPLMLAN